MSCHYLDQAFHHILERVGSAISGTLPLPRREWARSLDAYMSTFPIPIRRRTHRTTISKSRISIVVYPGDRGIFPVVDNLWSSTVVSLSSSVIRSPRHSSGTFLPGYLSSSLVGVLSLEDLTVSGFQRVLPPCPLVFVLIFLPSSMLIGRTVDSFLIRRCCGVAIPFNELDSIVFVYELKDLVFDGELRNTISLPNFLHSDRCTIFQKGGPGILKGLERLVNHLGFGSDVWRVSWNLSTVFAMTSFVSFFNLRRTASHVSLKRLIKDFLSVPSMSYVPWLRIGWRDGRCLLKNHVKFDWHTMW